MKRTLITAITIITCALITIPGYAASFVDHAQFANLPEADAVKRVEQTKWYFRMRNGVAEKRLWSITYGIWLTDWIPV